MPAVFNMVSRQKKKFAQVSRYIGAILRKLQIRVGIKFSNTLWPICRISSR